jgi:hypothetical protein
MLRKLALGLVAAATLGAMALAPTAASAGRGAVDGVAAGAIIITTSATASASASSVAAMATTDAM